MKTIMKILIIGMLAVMFVAPATAVAEPSVTILVDKNDGNGFQPLTDSYIPEGTVCDFKAEFKDFVIDPNDLNSFIFWGFEVSIYPPGESKFEYLRSDWESTPVSHTMGEDETFTIEAAALSYAPLVVVSSNEVTSTPEAATIAMTAIGLLAVLGFVFRRKEEQ